MLEIWKRNNSRETIAVNPDKTINVGTVYAFPDKRSRDDVAFHCHVYYHDGEIKKHPSYWTNSRTLFVSYEYIGTLYSVTFGKNSCGETISSYTIDTSGETRCLEHYKKYTIRK